MLQSTSMEGGISVFSSYLNLSLDSLWHNQAPTYAFNIGNPSSYCPRSDIHASSFLLLLFTSWPGRYHVIPQALSMDPYSSTLFFDLPWWRGPIPLISWSLLPSTLPCLHSICFSLFPSVTLPSLGLQYIYSLMYSLPPFPHVSSTHPQGIYLSNPASLPICTPLVYPLQSISHFAENLGVHLTLDLVTPVLSSVGRRPNPQSQVLSIRYQLFQS